MDDERVLGLGLGLDVLMCSVLSFAFLPVAAYLLLAASLLAAGRWAVGGLRHASACGVPATVGQGGAALLDGFSLLAC
jgi:hypothetical protein